MSFNTHTPNGLWQEQVMPPAVVPLAGRKWIPQTASNVSETIRYLTEGSIWIDDQQRTILVWKIHWANAVNVESFDLLIIPEMKIARNQPASKVEAYVRAGIIQYCRDCVRV